jgi:hypothetical protein
MSMDPGLDSSTSNDEAYRHMNNITFHGHVNPTYTASRPGSVTSFSTAAGASLAPTIPLMPTIYGRDTPTPPPPPPPPHAAASGVMHQHHNGDVNTSTEFRPKSAMSAYSNYHAHRQPYSVANNLYSAGGAARAANIARGQTPTSGEARREDGFSFDHSSMHRQHDHFLPPPLDSNSTGSSIPPVIGGYQQAPPPAPVRPTSRNAGYSTNRPYSYGNGTNSETVI